MDLWFLYVNPAELPASFVIEQGDAPPVVVVQPAVYGNYTSHASQSEPVYATAEYREVANKTNTTTTANATAISGSGYAPVAQRVEVVNDYYGSKPGNTVVSPFTALRQMRITIPVGSVPGQTITAVSPDGVTVSVSIPMGVQAGQSVLVNY